MAELQAIWTGTFEVFGVPVVCHVLNDGRRIIEAESMNALFTAMADQGEQPTTPTFEAQALEFAKWVKGEQPQPGKE